LLFKKNKNYVSEEQVSIIDGMRFYNKLARPILGADAVLRILQNEFQVQVKEESVRSLESYEDFNFVFTSINNIDKSRNGKFVFKLHNSFDSMESTLLEAQKKLLDHVQSVCVPMQLFPNKSIDVDGVLHTVRILTFVDGVMLSDVVDKSLKLFYNIGYTFGLLDLDLKSFDHHGMHRHLIWDIKNTLDTVATFRSSIHDSNSNSLIEKGINLFESIVLTRVKKLRTQVIHSDGNDHNIVVREDDSIGIIDFGDANESWLVGEIAIAMAYVIITTEDLQCKLSNAKQVLLGYLEAVPLNEDEMECIFPLIVGRIMVSVTVSAKSSEKFPQNSEYFLVHAKPAWAALEFLLKDIELHKVFVF